MVIKLFAVIERFAKSTLHLRATLNHLLTNSKTGHFFIGRRKQLSVNA